MHSKVLITSPSPTKVFPLIQKFSHSFVNHNHSKKNLVEALNNENWRQAMKVELEALEKIKHEK